MTFASTVNVPFSNATSIGHLAIRVIGSGAGLEWMMRFSYLLALI